MICRYIITLGIAVTASGIYGVANEKSVMADALDWSAQQ